eukprot:CAMPEP_0171622480 /NCGR_PEP_ID=MMETSP0990-20121206/17277_1 /TAXON_ID=483369 /ORGANISM="non described non described, Strain CCMP2098" /LENGTH=289 /DNA_ID=CAMNT_0012188303 /DNA_START=44 /DNA_END=913 /DNA_ORIENTATION=+
MKTFCALLALHRASGFHDHHSPSKIPTPAPTHDPTPTWEPTSTHNPSHTPTSVPTINDPGVIEKIWFNFVDVDRLDVQWEMPTGYDDEGLRIKKYEVEVRQLRTHIARYWTEDLDDLTHSFTGLDCNKEYRVRVRAWNEYGADAKSTWKIRGQPDSAAGPWGYSQFRKTRGCPLPAAPSDLTITGVNKAGLEIAWAAPSLEERERMRKQKTVVPELGYYSIRFRPKGNGFADAEWATAKAGDGETVKTLWAEKHGTECGRTYEVQMRTVGAKHNKGPWLGAMGSTQPCE